MTLTAEERRAINRKNSARSTGPRSAAGKARASQNALKHGLRAEAIALPNEDVEELKQLTNEWVDYYQPASPGHRALLDRAVLATVQLRRCARFQAATLAKQVREAEGRWDQQQEEEVERFKPLLKTDPSAAVRGLERSALGCRWLIEQWDGLKSGLDRNGCWFANSDCEQALRLLGKTPDLFCTDHDVFWFQFVNLSAHPSPPEGRLEWFLDNQRMHGTSGRLLIDCDPTDHEESVKELRAIVESQLQGLRGREERLRLGIEEPGRAEAGDRALLLTGPEGSLWLRYERMHDAAFHRAYKSLLKGEEESESTSAPAASKGANEFPEAPGPDEWSCPCGASDPMEVPVDSCMFFEVGPGLSEEAGISPNPPTEPAPVSNESNEIQEIAPNEATEAPETEAAEVDRREIDGIEAVKRPEGAGIPAVDSPVKADPAGFLPVGAA
jgi:hypothetical protein